MNPQLQKLVEYALVDGYITDKEKQVLIKKAQNLGFDIDELEMILEGKLYEINNTGRPKVNKCPNCGETLSGLNRVCPSCDYVLYSESAENIQTLDEMMRSLDNSIDALKAVPKPGSSGIIGSVLLIVFTAGLYIIYKKAIKREALFDRYAYINQKIIASTDSQVRNLRTKYGADQKVSTYINERLAERNAIISKRQNADAITATLVFIVVCIIVGFGLYTSTLPPTAPKPESAEKRTAKLIEEKKIGSAKKTASQIEDATDRDKYLAEIRELEIDSLTNAGDYNGAIKLAREIKNSAGYMHEREDRVDDIIEKQINVLIDNKDFEYAKELAELVQYPKKNVLLTSISVAESMEKSKVKKSKK